MTLDLSLYRIEEDLVSLLVMREEAKDPEEIRVLDQQLAEYFQAEIRKVDGIRAWWKYCEVAILAAKNERDAQTQRVRVWENRLARLRERVQWVMEGIPWPEGKPRRLEGQTGSISLKNNGGRQAVEIRDPNLVPEDYVQYRGALSGRQWRVLEDAARRMGERGLDLLFALRSFERVPQTERISQALESRCPDCDGSGIEGLSGPCPTCGGTGRRSVAGCSLAPRGQHVSVT